MLVDLDQKTCDRFKYFWGRAFRSISAKS